MRKLLIAAVATTALAVAGAAGAQTAKPGGTTNTGTNANMMNTGAAPMTTNAQQPQKKMKTTSRKHAAVHHRGKHKMARKNSSHRLAKKSSTHRLAHKGSSHRVVKRSTSGQIGLAAGKMQKQQHATQSKKRMPNRETTGSGTAGSMQNTAPKTTTNPNMQK